jgi:hypothetical protein
VTKIQTLARGFLVRKGLREKQEAAVRLQASFRGFVAKRTVQQRREHKQYTAAIRMQVGITMMMMMMMMMMI